MSKGGRTLVGDAVSVASNNYRVLLENDRVRLLEYRGQPGDKTAMHSHPDSLAYALTDFTGSFTFPDGQTVPVGLKAGDSMFAEAVEHTTESGGDSEARVLLIELK